jgi:hypothetical protein
VTIAGRGGRPRKWRSDADRARAYRARQRGEPEPEQLSQIDRDSDELAAARHQAEQLGALIRDLRQTERSVRAELGRTQRALEAERSHAERLLDANRLLLQQVDTGTSPYERDGSDLTDPQGGMPQEVLKPPSSRNRAERRRLARELRRRR